MPNLPAGLILVCAGPDAVPDEQTYLAVLNISPCFSIHCKTYQLCGSARLAFKQRCKELTIWQSVCYLAIATASAHAQIATLDSPNYSATSQINSHNHNQKIIAIPATFGENAVFLIPANLNTE